MQKLRDKPIAMQELEVRKKKIAEGDSSIVDDNEVKSRLSKSRLKEGCTRWSGLLDPKSGDLQNMTLV